jgi:ribosomal protein S18 acetylase RimI-like enzyme
MIWRALKPGDIPAACGLSFLAGWNQTATDWAGYLTFEPEGCFALEIHGVLAGTATAICYGETLGWIGMVLVHPDYRRRGLGSMLLRRTIDYLRARGVGSIKLDATPAGRLLYTTLGFRDEYELTRWEGWTPPAMMELTSSSTTLGFELGANGPLFGAVADFDARAFGVHRGKVLATLSGRAPELCFIARRQAEIDAYLIARDGREAVQLGPWVARDARSAENLWGAFCRAAPGRRIFLDLPVANVAGTSLLTSFGFKVQRSFTRMFLGDSGPRDNPTMIYSTSGAEKG